MPAVPGRGSRAKVPGGWAVIVTLGSVGDTNSVVVDQDDGSRLGRSLALPFWI